MYSTKCKGIGGQLKRRYTDFIVEEIEPNGRVCEVKRFLGGDFEPGNVEVPENTENMEQLRVDMEKINKDINFCVTKITRFLQCSKKRVGYAGMKDKRAVTCQRISIFDPDLERLKVFRSKGIDLRNAEWSNERVEIGGLKENKFRITVRDLDLDEKELRKRIGNCIKEINENGTANFFGEQRFGGIRKVTHLVGREFINGDPEKAVMLYLTATAPQEEDEIKEARIELAKTQNFSEASKKFPVKFRYERTLIHHLCKYPKDFVGAFRQLPRSLAYLFTHAYQSYLFNEIISERMRLGWDLKEVTGDILMNNVPTAPLYGFESKLAEDEAGEVEKRVLEKEGRSLSDFKIKEMPELSSKGARKEIVLKPQNMKLEEIGEDEFYEGKKFAVVSFTLSKGNYATTVMREMMKVD